MTEHRKGYLPIAACTGFLLLLFIGSGFGVHWYRSSRASAFCRQVAALPQSELADFASRCGSLWAEKGGHSAQWTSISESNILTRFTLAGRKPEVIYVDDHMVSANYLRAAPRSGAMVQWTDYSQWGEPTWKLRAVYGDTGGGVVYERDKTRGESDGSANGSQPVRSGTNQSSAAANPGR
jgi:hypothetical protein